MYSTIWFSLKLTIITLEEFFGVLRGVDVAVAPVDIFDSSGFIDTAL